MCLTIGNRNGTKYGRVEGEWKSNSGAVNGLLGRFDSGRFGALPPSHLCSVLKCLNWADWHICCEAIPDELTLGKAEILGYLFI